MIRIIVRVKDKYKIEKMEKYGSVIYKSPILNVIGLELDEKFLNELQSDENVLSYEVESKGTLMPV